MKLHLRLRHGLLSLLAAAPLPAAIMTWDGGSLVDSNLLSGDNWSPNGIPLTTDDLVFAGVVRLTPAVTSTFTANSLTFNNTAGAFSFGGTGTLRIGTGGITNNDANLMTFNNAVAANASMAINGTSGGLAFNGGLNLGTNTVTLNGANPVTLGSLTGTGTLTKAGSGLLTLNASATSIGADLNINLGTLALSVAGASQTFAGTSSITVNTGANFTIDQDMVLDAGAQLSRAGGAILIAAGKTLTIKGGSGYLVNTGSLGTAGGNLTITGAGSTLQNAASSLSVTGSSTVSVQSGGSIGASGFLDVSTGTLSVDGTGSAASAPGNSFWGGSGVAVVSFSNGASGEFSGGLKIAQTGTATGIALVQSGANLTTGNIELGNTTTTANGTLTVDGPDSTWKQSGAAALTIGAASGSTAEFEVQNSGVFHTGTGLTTVNPTGHVKIAGGTLNVNGDMTLTGNGLRLECDATGTFSMVPGKLLKIQGGADANFGGTFGIQGNTTVTGGGSSLFANSDLFAGNAGVLNVQSGGTAASSLSIRIGTTGNGTVMVDGTGSNLISNKTDVGGLASTGILTLSNGSTGLLGNLGVGVSNFSGTTGTVNIESGSSATVSGLAIAPTNASTTTALTVTGTGSVLTHTGTGASPFIVGSQSPSGNVALNVQNGGTVHTGTGALTVNRSGRINIIGGTFNANGSLTVSGGQVTRDNSGVLNLAAARRLDITDGGDVSITGPWQQPVRSDFSVFGTGSSFTTTGDFQWEGDNTIQSGLTVMNGGVLSSGGALHLGRNNTAVSLQITGVGAQATASPSSTSEWQADVRINTESSATLGHLRLADIQFASPASASLSVEQRSTVTVGNLRVATDNNAGNTAVITVDGQGSRITQTGASTFMLGAFLSSSATLNVNSGGAFATGTGQMTVLPTGTVNINGGTLTVKGTLLNSGAFNFTAGSLNLLDTSGLTKLTVGAGGLLGVNLTLLADRSLTVGSATIVEPSRTLTLDGGTLRTAFLVNNGTLDFQRGTLGITGTSGFNVGTGALGASVTLGAGANLDVTATATVEERASLTVDGGAFSAGSALNNGLLEILRGTATIQGTLTNATNGEIHASRPFSVFGTFTNQLGSRFTLRDGTGRLNGPGTLTNSGLVNGDGTIATEFTNSSSGEVRAEAGTLLAFTGATGPSAGRLNLQGGTLSFSQNHTCSAGGQINGHGALFFPATSIPSSASPAAGLNCSGQMNLSGGDSLIFGTVAMNAGSRLVASGGATATFFDVFRHSGAEVKASAGSNLVFFGEVRGAGSFTGAGTIYMEGGYSPGASPASVAIAPQMVFTNSNTLTMELGGTVTGSEHDKLVFTSAATPQVTWSGSMVVTFIDGYIPVAGHEFDLFDFDHARDSGVFDTLILPSLPAGLAWDSARLYTAGILRIITPGITYSQWAATVLGDPLATPTDDHDHDGFNNAAEFVLGLEPPQPGTVFPGGGLHSYADGERLRFLFTRPLDRSGVTLHVQASSDLTTWVDIAESVDSAAFTGPGFVSENRAHPLSEPGLVEVRDILTTSAAPHRQIRLQITLTP